MVEKMVFIGCLVKEKELGNEGGNGVREFVREWKREEMVARVEVVGLGHQPRKGALGGAAVGWRKRKGGKKVKEGERWLCVCI